MKPGEYSLQHIFPSQSTGLPRLEYAIPVESAIVLELYDLSGDRIMTLVDGKQNAGVHSYDLSTAGGKLDEGTYYCRLAAYDSSARMQYVNVKKLTIAR